MVTHSASEGNNPLDKYFIMLSIRLLYSGLNCIAAIERHRDELRIVAYLHSRFTLVLRKIVYKFLSISGLRSDMWEPAAVGVWIIRRDGSFLLKCVGNIGQFKILLFQSYSV
jgi:hypothetical protein